MKWILVFVFSFYSFAWGQSAAEALRITSKNSNFYEVLNISSDATEKEIKTAYRRLMSIYHPDRHQGNPANLKAATQVMTKLNAARETLLDPLKRKSYDITVKATAPVKPKPASPPPKPASADWQKYSYSDFKKPEPKAEAPKPEAKEKPRPEPEKPKSPPPRSENVVKPEPAKAAPPATPEKTVAQGSVQRMEPQNLRVKEALKMYSETSQCGVGYIKSFVDIIQ